MGSSKKNEIAGQHDWMRRPIEVRNSGLYCENHAIVEKWERPIQKQLAISACPIRGMAVLEIGYGLGMAATAVSKQFPRTHYIVEAHPKIAALAEERFFESNLNVVVIRGCWED